MQVRNVLLVGTLVGLSGLAFWDYNSADSKREREIRNLEKLAPDVEVPACYPKHPRAKIFAMAAFVDRRAVESLPTEQLRRGMLLHDCIRGADSRGDIDHVATVLGDEGVPLYEAILEQCKVDKLDVSPSACFALDALAKHGSPKAIAAMEKVLTERKQIKDVWLGALQRLVHVEGWRTRVQLAAMVPQEKNWEAKELLIEAIREKRDPAARDAISQAMAAETDAQEKGKLQAALLELDNPGRCVVEDSGAGADGICRYYCMDQKARFKVPKMGQTCPLVREMPPPEPAVSGVAGGSQ